MTRVPPLAVLLLLAIAHLVLSMAFSSVTPYRTPGTIGGTPAPDIGAPDEIAHIAYIQHILDGKGFPNLDLERMRGEPSYRANEYENHQPPLYYFLAAGVAKLTGRTDLSDPGNGRLVRGLNAAIGFSTILGIFFAALWAFKRHDLGLGAAAIAAFLPMNIALDGAISNDPLLIALLTWLIALCARALSYGWNWRLALGIGAIAAFATLTKTTGLVALPVIFAALLVPQAVRPRLSWAFYASALFITLTAPWAMRNQRIYGDPLALKVFQKAFEDTATKDMMVSGPAGSEANYWTNWVGWWTARSFIGTFGYMDVWINESGTMVTGPKSPNLLYRLTSAGFAILTLGWLVSLQTEWGKQARSFQIVCGTLLFFVILLFIQFNTKFFQAQGRYLYPALAPLVIGWAGGAIALAGKRSSTAIASVALALFCLDIYTFSRLPAEFARRATAEISLREPIKGQQSTRVTAVRRQASYFEAWCRS